MILVKYTDPHSIGPYHRKGSSFHIHVGQIDWRRKKLIEKTKKIPSSRQNTLTSTESTQSDREDGAHQCLSNAPSLVRLSHSCRWCERIVDVNRSPQAEVTLATAGGASTTHGSDINAQYTIVCGIQLVCVSVSVWCTYEFVAHEFTVLMMCLRTRCVGDPLCMMCT